VGRRRGSAGGSAAPGVYAGLANLGGGSYTRNGVHPSHAGKRQPLFVDPPVPRRVGRCDRGRSPCTLEHPPINGSPTSASRWHEIARRAGPGLDHAAVTAPPRARAADIEQPRLKHHRAPPPDRGDGGPPAALGREGRLGLVSRERVASSWQPHRGESASTTSPTSGLTPRRTCARSIECRVVALHGPRTSVFVRRGVDRDR